MLKYGNYFIIMKKLLTRDAPSAQWKDDSVFDINKWGHGYYNYSDVAGTIRDYDNGEIVDIPHNDINLYDFVKTENN